MITADGGGSNGTRVRLWKVELQKLADETGLTLDVCHYPPGTSKWNKIEHRLFCHITQNWRGTPLISRQAIVELIGAITTGTGLKVKCELDTKTYEKGVKVTDADMATLNIKGAKTSIQNGIMRSLPNRQDEALTAARRLGTASGRFEGVLWAITSNSIARSEF